MGKEKTIIIVKECAAIAVALGATLLISHTLLSPGSPDVNTNFIAQIGNKAQSFIANAINSLNDHASSQTTAQDTQEAAPRPNPIISQDQEKQVVSITFPKDFVYKLGSDGIYR